MHSFVLRIYSYVFKCNGIPSDQISKYISMLSEYIRMLSSTKNICIVSMYIRILFYIGILFLHSYTFLHSYNFLHLYTF